MESNRDLCIQLVEAEEAKDPTAVAGGLLLLWDALCCSRLPTGLDLFILDTAAVCGIGPTVRWLGLACSAVDPTPDLAADAASQHPARVVILDVESFRKRALRSIPGWIDHHTKWVNRLLRIKRQAVKMVNRELEARAGALCGDGLLKSG